VMMCTAKSLESGWITFASPEVLIFRLPRNMPIQAQRGCWSTALSTHNLGTESSIPRPLYPHERSSTLVQEVWWALGLAWTGPENLSPTRIQSLDCPGSSKLLHWLCNPSHKTSRYTSQYFDANYTEHFQNIVKQTGYTLRFQASTVK
jgi:hypothetical protein